MIDCHTAYGGKSGTVVAGLGVEGEVAAVVIERFRRMAVKTPQYSVKLGWNKALKRNDRVVVRVALHRIPTEHINVDVQKDRVKVDTLRNSRKFVLEYDPFRALVVSAAQGCLGLNTAGCCCCRCLQDPISCRSGCR